MRRLGKTFYYLLYLLISIIAQIEAAHKYITMNEYLTKYQRENHFHLIQTSVNSEWQVNWIHDS